MPRAMREIKPIAQFVNSDVEAHMHYMLLVFPPFWILYSNLDPHPTKGCFFFNQQHTIAIKLLNVFASPLGDHLFS